MNNKIKIVGATIVLAVVFALPISALVAGILWFVAPATFPFLPTLAYATLGCGAYNALRSWPRIKAQLDWAAGTAD